MVVYNQRGFSLISVMMASALVGVLASGIMSLSTNIFAIAESSENVRQMGDELYYLHASLADENTCTANLRLLKVDGGSETPIAMQTPLRYSASPDSQVLGEHPIMPSQAGTGATRLKIKNMTLRRHPGSPNIAVMRIDFETRSDTLGGRLRHREIPLNIAVDGDSRITRCAAGVLSGGGIKGEQVDRGQHQGTYTGRNDQPYAIMVTAYGGNPLATGSNRKGGEPSNRCHLKGPTGLTADFHPQWIKVCFMTFYVKAGAEYTVESNLEEWGGLGYFNIIETH